MYKISLKKKEANNFWLIFIAKHNVAELSKCVCNALLNLPFPPNAEDIYMNVNGHILDTAAVVVGMKIYNNKTKAKIVKTIPIAPMLVNFS